jgi:hypothetical protein
MSMTDQYPLMSRHYTVAALKIRFGADNVTCDQDQVTVSAQYPGRQGLTLANLTIEQAKFVVANPISFKDLVDEDYPETWPGPRSPSTIPRPIQIAVVPLPFTTFKDLTTAPQFSVFPEDASGRTGTCRLPITIEENLKAPE